jgi:hypothetical protein
MNKNNYGEVARQVMREKLIKHLDVVEELISTWLQQVSVPEPFIIEDKTWPIELEYIPSSTKDEDKNHMIRRHLHSRMLWRNYSDWERKIRDIELCGKELYKKVKKGNPNTSKIYLHTILWAAYRIVTGKEVKKKYGLVEDKDLTFYGYVIADIHPEVLNEIENEHWESISDTSEYKEMTDIVKIRLETEPLQERISDLANKILLSGDIFYPCKFCRRLMKA